MILSGTAVTISRLIVYVLLRFRISFMCLARFTLVVYFQQYELSHEPEIRSIYFQTKDQISLVSDCGLTKVGTLDFGFLLGSCFSNQNYILLCFSEDNLKQCRRSSDPLGTFEELEKSQFSHYAIRLSASEGKQLK